MDLLASLGLGTDLPEQSTRLGGMENLLEGNDDVRLGFNRCLTCGKSITSNDAVVSCQSCNRVSYCSTKCRKMDSSQPLSNDDDDEEEAGVGHSPIICSLLNLCNDDEAAEEEQNEMDKKKKKGSNNKKKDYDTKVNHKQEAAKYRITTELESYPATLFNIISEGPHWFVESITRKLRYNEDVRSPEPPTKKQRRGKRDRNSTSPMKESDTGSRRKELVLHIVGASVDSELWNYDGSTTTSKKKGAKKNNDDEEEEDVFRAYAEAATNLSSYIKNLLEISINLRLVFVGPDCPKQKSFEVPIPDSNSSMLTFETHKCYYGSSEQPYLPVPDVIIFFNPGFSCPDYEWAPALQAACAYQASSSSTPTPFLVNTNTEMEGFADIKYLLDGGYMNAKSLPNDILEAVDYASNGNEDENFDDDISSLPFFFSLNPYAGLRVRQSGTMGNDLYVKNRWIIGGLLDSSSISSGTGKKKRKSGTKSSSESRDIDEETEKKSRKRQRRSDDGDDTSSSKAGRNTKRKNPALI